MNAPPSKIAFIGARFIIGGVLGASGVTKAFSPEFAANAIGQIFPVSQLLSLVLTYGLVVGELTLSYYFFWNRKITVVSFLCSIFFLLSTVSNLPRTPRRIKFSTHLKPRFWRGVRVSS